jgi:anoctamin-10
MLKYLACLAIVTIIIDSKSNLFQITNIASIYAVITMIWSTFFIIAWRRKESELSIEWGVFG